MKKKNKQKDTKLQEEAAIATEEMQEPTDQSVGEAEQPEADEISLLHQKIAEQDDRHLRLFAEFENYKKRNQRERLQLMETAGRKTMSALLPVLDDFDRARKVAEQNDELEAFETGIGVVIKKLRSTLEGQGLRAMQSTGEAFDADLHEAITEIPAPTDELKGKVVDTVETGYSLNGTIIRHAKVVVGK